MMEALTRIRFYERNPKDLLKVDEVLRRVGEPKTNPVSLFSEVATWIVDRSKRGFSDDDV